MNIEIVQSSSIGELDGLINSCIEKRIVFDVKIISHVLHDDSVLYTALIMLGD